MSEIVRGPADTTDPKERLRLAFMFLAGPLGWGLALLAGYGLVSVSCALGVDWPLYAVVFIALMGLAVLISGVMSFANWRHWSQRGHAAIDDVDEAPGTRAFIAISGALLNAIFFLLIVVTGVVAFFLSPCGVINMPLP